MSYRGKIREFQTVAKNCLKTGRYNSAANRYYYAAFLLVKNWVSPEDDSPVEHGDILKGYYTKMYEQGTPVSKEDSLALKANWSILYKHRIKADYRTGDISRERAVDSMNSFNKVKEVVWKQPINK